MSHPPQDEKKNKVKLKHQILINHEKGKKRPNHA